MSDETLIKLASILGLSVAIPATVWALAWMVVELFHHLDHPHPPGVQGEAMSLTDEWLETVEQGRKDGDLGKSIFFRLALDYLPIGVDTADPRVRAAIEEIRQAVDREDAS